ncbi:MAG: nuclear transport factor 2 family protein, partial [Myxococcales bacterium]|nr:nuclear transport factor 2 family protein [Myxococcales bacterium]
MTIQRFLEYAAAFERGVEADDWDAVRPFFAEDAVYETVAPPPLGGRREGRERILAYFKESLDGFDRRFDSRALAVLEGPTERPDGSVWVRWSAAYRRAGAPDLTIEGEGTAEFAGDAIRRLVDTYPPEMGPRVMGYFAEHGGKLKGMG